MKISLALGPRRPLSRQTAWGCLTTNLALPGSGSLAAGRRSGFGQVILAIGGMVVTILFGTRFVIWYVANWSRLHQSQTDPIGALLDLWQMFRWPLLGMGIFLIGWVWALATSLAMVYSATKTEAPSQPPQLP